MPSMGTEYDWYPSDVGAADEAQGVAFEWPCPACGEYPDYCAGHGVIGDPILAEVLERHDAGDHTSCVPSAVCGETP